MNPKKKIFIISAISGLITLALIGFVIYPLFKGIKETSQELIAVKKELALIQTGAENVKQIEESYQALKTDLEKIDRLLIDPEVPIDLIEFWESLAADLEISIDISPFSIRVSETDPWDSIGFQITLIGSLPNFLKFLEKMEYSPYLIEIQNLAIKKLAGKGLKLEGYEQISPGDISGTLVAKIYTK